MGISDVRGLGLVGSIIVLFDLYLGYLGVQRTGLLAVVGLVLLLIGVREIAREANYPKIFRNYLIYFIFTALFFVFQQFTLNLVFLWILLLIGAIFLRMSFNKIEVSSGVVMFRYTALIYLIGAVLSIFVVGLIILPIALALQAVAFYALPDTIGQIQEEYPEEIEEEAPIEEGYKEPEERL
ncbi:MAG: DUF996 domain-containing protein [Archaeoglobaceae archaeon]|nr:DUF996 domain-containing protein [Archaeoglobaceae archaeon]MDW8118400.1 DUF996 domain-containing protein [Archaeoglobaceae archaeon]